MLLLPADSMALLRPVAPLGAAVLAASSVRASVATQPTATTMPTLPPQPTATPKPLSQQPMDTPTLGGLWHYFENTYGSELDGQQNTWGATIAGQPVTIYVDFSHDSDSADGQPRAAIINLFVPDQFIGQEIWSPSTANAIAHAFLPTDARYVSDRQYTGWVDHTERSSRLAASFTSGIFTTEDGDKMVTPGDLHWFCDLTTQMDNCYVSVGTANQ